MLDQASLMNKAMEMTENLDFSVETTVPILCKWKIQASN